MRHLLQELFDRMLPVDAGVWRPCNPMRKRQLISGEYSTPPELLMRAVIDGRVVFRRPTASEADDYVSRDAW